MFIISHTTILAEQVNIWVISWNGKHFQTFLKPLYMNSTKFNVVTKPRNVWNRERMWRIWNKKYIWPAKCVVWKIPMYSVKSLNWLSITFEYIYIYNTLFWMLWSIYFTVSKSKILVLVWIFNLMLHFFP